jgi:hypothetical protein
LSTVMENDPESSLAEFLAAVDRKGVRLWLQDGQLRYKMLKDALSPSELQRLKAAKHEIAMLVAGEVHAAMPEPRVSSTLDARRAPLTFSQLAHWRERRLEQRHSQRDVASALLIEGCLDVDAFKSTIREVVRRHEALRTRIVVYDGSPVQEIDESRGCDLHVCDLAGLSGIQCGMEVLRRIEEFILEPVDVAAGSLFGVQLLRLGEHQYVLAVAMEHVIADATSLNIVSRELCLGYSLIAQGRTLALPTVPVQLSDYARWQRHGLHAWLENHATHWRKRLLECGRLRFPRDTARHHRPRQGWGSVPFPIDQELKARLREWCRARGTTLALCVFAVYVGLVLRWCDTSDAVILYQTDGRQTSGLENTVGFIASRLYLRIQLREEDRFADLIERVTNEYCSALEHDDHGYWASQNSPPECARNTLFNWIPHVGLGDYPLLDEATPGLSISPLTLADPSLRLRESDDEPWVIFYDEITEITGRIYFALDRHSAGTMERLASSFRVLIEALLEDSHQRVAAVALA